MTPSDFNQRLLQAKDTALDTLEDLCAPAFPKRSRIPTTRDDGTLIPYEEQLAMSRLQPPRLDYEDQHVIVMERTQRMRAASTILKTRPIGDDGNPLPISKVHPEHHTRTRPRSDRDSTNHEGGGERAGDDQPVTSAADHARDDNETTNSVTPSTGSPLQVRVPPCPSEALPLHNPQSTSNPNDSAPICGPPN